MTGKDQLRNARNKIQDHEQLDEDEKQLLSEDFVHELRQGENISSDYTFAKHLRKIRNIVSYNDWNACSFTPSLGISKNVRGQIQRSDYKIDTSENSQFSKKNKQDHWTAWKYFLKHCKNIQRPETSDALPPASFSSNKEEVDVQAATNPKDLPNRRQFRKLLKTLKQQSRPKTEARNVAFFMLLWDTGMRAGEILELELGDVEIRRGNLYVQVTGNKGSDDRENRIYQGEHLLKNYYKNHPGLGNPDAYLFCKSHKGKLEDNVSSNQMAKSMRKAKASASLDFKDYGEPLHIFRKAMSTFLVVNGIMDWETVASRQGKNSDSTKPDYILKAEEDREMIEAKGFGLDVDDDGSGEKRGHMTDKPLMPQECQGCEATNSCLNDECVKCQGELEYSTLPKSEEERKEAEENMSRMDELEQRLADLEG